MVKKIEEYHIPDIIDLQTWLVLNTDPEIIILWKATKYLSDPYDIWVYIWETAGRPDITEKA